MKVTIMRAIMLATSLLASLGYAQERKTIRVEIPFAFRAGNTQLPAGEYVVWQNPASSYVALAATSGNARAALFGNPSEAQTRDDATLTFHRYGDKYFLAEIRSTCPVHLSKSAAERETERAGATLEIASIRIPK